jgi:hypothetical protein
MIEVASPDIWGYAPTRDTESWNRAEPDTREGAIACGRREYGSDHGFWITRGAYPDPAPYFPHVETMLEMAGEALYDELGETHDPWPGDPGPEAKAELGAAIATWARAHCPVGTWYAVGEPEFVGAQSEAP